MAPMMLRTTIALSDRIHDEGYWMYPAFTLTLSWFCARVGVAGLVFPSPCSPNQRPCGGLVYRRCLLQPWKWSVGTFSLALISPLRDMYERTSGYLVACLPVLVWPSNAHSSLVGAHLTRLPVGH